MTVFAYFRQNLAKIGQDRSKSGLRRPKSGPEPGPAGRGQNGVKMGSKWGQNGVRDRVGTGTGSGTRFWTVFGPGQKGVKKGSKKGFFGHFFSPPPLFQKPGNDAFLGQKS